MAEMANCSIRYALDHISLAQGLQLQILWWAKPRGMGSGVHCLKVRKGAAERLRKAMGN